MIIRLKNVVYNEKTGLTVAYTERIGANVVNVCRKLVADGIVTVGHYKFIITAMVELFNDLRRTEDEGIVIGNISSENIFFSWDGTHMKCVDPLLYSENVDPEKEDIILPYYDQEFREERKAEDDWVAWWVLINHILVILTGEEADYEFDQSTNHFLCQVKLTKTLKQQLGFSYEINMDFR